MKQSKLAIKNVLVFLLTTIISLISYTKIRGIDLNKISFVQYSYIIIFSFILFNFISIFVNKELFIYEDYIIKEIKDCIKTSLSIFLDKKLLIGTILIFLCVFGYSISNFSISIDEEFQMAQQKDSTQWCYEGRFTIAVLKGIFMQFGTFPPYIACFLAAIIYTLAGAIILRIIKNNESQYCGNSFSSFIFFAGFLSLPAVIIEIMSFNTYCIEVTTGIAVMASSVYMFERFAQNRRLITLALSIFMCVFSLGVYQAMANVYITLIIICVYLKILNKENLSMKEIMKYIMSSIAVLLISLILYYIIYNFAISIHKSEMSIVYINDFSGWSLKLGLIPSLKNSIYALVQLVTNNHYLVNKYYIYYIFVGLFCAFCFFIYKHKLRYFVPFIFFIIVVFSGFIMWVGLASTFLPYRAWVSTPIICGFIYYQSIILFCDIFSKYDFLKKAVYALIFVILFRQIQTTGQLFYNDHIRAQKDIEFATQIYYDVCRQTDLPINDTPIIFLGTRNLGTDDAIEKNISNGKRWGGNVLGCSIWSRAQEDIRISGLYKSLGYDVKVENCYDRAILSELNEKMTVYPKEGSICEKDGKIYVKLQELQDGFVEKNGKYYYYLNGIELKGQHYIEGSWYCFDYMDDFMITGLYSDKVKGETYYFNSEGQMQYGKQIIDGKEYYFNPETGALEK